MPIMLKIMLGGNVKFNRFKLGFLLILHSLSHTFMYIMKALEPHEVKAIVETLHLAQHSAKVTGCIFQLLKYLATKMAKNSIIINRMEKASSIMPAQ